VLPKTLLLLMGGQAGPPPAELGPSSPCPGAQDVGGPLFQPRCWPPVIRAAAAQGRTTFKRFQTSWLLSRGPINSFLPASPGAGAAQPTQGWDGAGSLQEGEAGCNGAKAREGLVPPLTVYKGNLGNRGLTQQLPKDHGQQLRNLCPH